MKTEAWRYATPEQRNLWNIARVLIAYNTITPLFYQGPIAGSEFETFNAAKVYLCLEFKATGALGAVGASVSNIMTYNMANGAMFSFGNNIVYWDGAIKHGANFAECKNFWFSRIVRQQYVDMVFNGYRLTIV